jgi:hypothetical protein
VDEYHKVMTENFAERFVDASDFNERLLGDRDANPEGFLGRQANY